MKGVFYVFFGAVSYGILSSLVKIGYSYGYDVSEVVTTQMSLGMIILLFLSFVDFLYLQITKQANKYDKFTRKEKLLLVSTGSVTGLTGILYYTALQYTSASFAIILLFQFTWIGMVLEKLFFKKNPSKEKLISLVILIIGTIAASNIIGSDVNVNIVGVVFGLLSALSYSVFILISGLVANDKNPVQKSTLMIIGGFIVTVIILRPTILLDFSKYYEVSSNTGIYLALFGPVISTLFFAKGAPLIGPALTSLIGAMELPTVICMSYFMLNEQITLVQILGVILILVAVSYPQLSMLSTIKSTA